MSDPTLPDSDRRDAEYLGDGVYAAHDGVQVWIRIGLLDKPLS